MRQGSTLWGSMGWLCLSVMEVDQEDTERVVGFVMAALGMVGEFQEQMPPLEAMDLSEALLSHTATTELPSTGDGDQGSGVPFTLSSLAVYVALLGLLPEYQRQGIGGQLMEYVEEFAVDNGCVAVFLHVMAKERRAVSFYSRRGFRSVGVVPGYYQLEAGDEGRPEGTTCDALLMVNRLQTFGRGEEHPPDYSTPHASSWPEEASGIESRSWVSEGGVEDNTQIRPNETCSKGATAGEQRPEVSSRDVGPSGAALMQGIMIGGVVEACPEGPTTVPGGLPEVVSDVDGTASESVFRNHCSRGGGWQGMWQGLAFWVNGCRSWADGRAEDCGYASIRGHPGGGDGGAIWMNAGDDSDRAHEPDRPRAHYDGNPDWERGVDEEEAKADDQCGKHDMEQLDGGTSGCASGVRNQTGVQWDRGCGPTSSATGHKSVAVLGGSQCQGVRPPGNNSSSFMLWHEASSQHGATRALAVPSGRGASFVLVRKSLHRSSVSWSRTLPQRVMGSAGAWRGPAAQQRGALRVA